MSFGRYYINNVNINNAVRYGILLVYDAKEYIIQQILSNNPEKYGVLVRGYNGTEWSQWKEFSFK